MQADTSNYQPLSLDRRAYKFFPIRQQEKHGFNKPDGTRVYFHGQVEHDDFQKKKIAEFKQFLKVKYQNNYDQNYFNTHLLLLFLVSTRYKNEETYKAMNQHMQFRKKYVRDALGNRIIKYETDQKVKLLIDAGFFYVCGRDHHFRPLIVFNLPKTDLKDTDAILRGIVFVQQQVIQKMFLPGQVQCWNIIYDLGGMGITDVPVNSLKGALKSISDNYGGRLYKLWLLNAPGTIYLSWKVVKNFLDPITVEKIHIIKKNTDDSLWKLFHKDQIQQKYGGTQPNKTTFYPFIIPKAYVDESRLLPDEKYAHLVQSGILKNNVIDPQYTNKKKIEQQKKRQAQAEQLEKQLKKKKEQDMRIRQAEQRNQLQRIKQHERKIQQEMEKKKELDKKVQQTQDKQKNQEQQSSYTQVKEPIEQKQQQC